MRPSLHLSARTPRLPIALLAVAMALLGAWGGIVPYVGPLFGYPLPAGTHQAAWQWTASHWQLYLVAGAATLAGALVLLAAGATGSIARWGALLGLIGGSWFMLGPVFAPAFLTGFHLAASGSTLMTVVTPLGYNDGTGLLIAIAAALALGLMRQPLPAGPSEEPEIYETSDGGAVARVAKYGAEPSEKPEISETAREHEATPNLSGAGSEPNAEALSVFVEIPTGSRNKYEFDPSRGGIVLDRRLFTSMGYPTDYGFVEGTRAADGDPLDALVLTAEPTFPGCRIRARAIGVFHMEDEHGSDDKLICVPVADTVYGRLGDANEIAPELRNEIEHFFQVYKTLEGKPTRTFGFSPRSEADRLLEESSRPFLGAGERGTS